MTLFEIYNSAFTHLHWAELVLRIVIATVCGSVVGLERSWRFKDAGIRTHSMVACTAALLMIISKYGFADLSTGDAFFPGVRGGDPARIAAQVVSGISFLGAGIIYRDRNFTTRGLTTAAGIWAVSGIGLAIGSGMYLIGIFTTVFIVLCQAVMHRIAIGNERVSDVVLEVVLRGDNAYPEELYRKLEEFHANISETQMTRENGETHYRFFLKLNADLPEETLHKVLFENAGVVSLKLNRDT